MPSYRSIKCHTEFPSIAASCSKPQLRGRVHASFPPDSVLSIRSSVQCTLSQHIKLFSDTFVLPHWREPCALARPFCTVSFTRSLKVESRVVDRALKILDLIVPDTDRVGEDVCHHRLIQGCMHDLVEISKHSSSKLRKKSKGTWTQLMEVIPWDVQDGKLSENWRTGILEEDDIRLFIESHRRGISTEATILSSIMRSCGATGALDTGLQLHALMVKAGFDECVYVGSSLISLYSKNGQLNNAYRVFQMLPAQNTISWTAIIAACAQNWQVETCLHLFISMKQAMLKPNDFTFSSVLSACTGSAYLGLGRSVQCLELRMGFDSYVHVSNALISMYAKCGCIDEAHTIFEKMFCKDLISWNSMIFGCAQYGLAEQALHLLEEMERLNVGPDSISFLGVLSSCRHAGLVEQGRRCFNVMLGRGIKPGLDHYSCIIDLLGRAGLLEEALEFIKKMPILPNAVIWGSLLSACRLHGNVWIGIQAAENRLLLEPGCAATHVQLANLYASIGCWNHVAEVRKLMKDRQLKTIPGYSWIEIGNRVNVFKAENRSNNQVNDILAILDSLDCHMKRLGYMPVINTDLDEMLVV